MWRIFVRQNDDAINSIPEVIKTLLVPLQRYRLGSLSPTVTAAAMATEGVAPKDFALATYCHAVIEGRVTLKMLHYL